MRRFAIAGFCFSLMCIPAMAGPAAEVLAAHAYDGTLTAGVNALDPLVQKGSANWMRREGDLAQVGDADVKLPLDLGKLRRDLNGDSHLATWNRMMDVFQGNFLGYAFYFN